MEAGVRGAQQQQGSGGMVRALPVPNLGQILNPSEWSTRLSQCDPPATMEDWCFSVWLLPCAAALAKSETDGTHGCYNFLCWHPIGGYSWVRNEYKIRGVCGDDCGYGIFCMCCTTRQMYTESHLRGKVQLGQRGLNMNRWNHSLFDCSFTECVEVLCCPCCVAHEARTVLQPAVAQDTCFDCCCVLPTAMYGQVRHQYGIISDCSVCEDLFIPVLCFPCALNQARKEARHYFIQAFAQALPFGGGRKENGGCC